MIDFTDFLTIHFIMAYRDHQREVQELQREKSKLIQKSFEDIGIYSERLVSVITNTANKANENYVEREIVEGVKLLPLYIFDSVLRIQKRDVTKEQDKLLDVYFSAINVGFTKRTFLMSQDIQREIIGRVGIGPGYASKFWIEVYKCLYVHDNAFEVLGEISKCYTELLIRFATLGHMRSDSVLDIGEAFIKALYDGLVAKQNEVLDDIDYVGIVPYLLHKNEMERLALEVERASGDVEMDLAELIPYFEVGMLRDLIDKSGRTSTEKARILDYAMEKSEIFFHADGAEIYRHVDSRTGMYNLISTITEQFIVTVLIMGMRGNVQDKAAQMVEEAIGYLCGIETDLVKEFPLQKLSGQAYDYIAKVYERALMSLK